MGRNVSLSSSASANTARSDRTPLQLAAMVVGAVFLLVGILGYIPGITTCYSDMSLPGTIR